MDPFAPANSPVNTFSNGAWITPLADKELTPRLALQQLAGWARLFEDPSRSPLRWRGDNLSDALNHWASEQDFSLLKLNGPEGYPIALELKMQLVHLNVMFSSSALTGKSIAEMLAEDPEVPKDWPTTHSELITYFKNIIEKAYPQKNIPGEPEIVVYTAPRFCSDAKILGVEELADRLVIDRNKHIPQNGFGYKFSEEDLRVMSWGFSSRLITLEFTEKIHGFYFLHLAFPEEPTSPHLSSAKTRAAEMGLMGDRLWQWGVFPDHSLFPDEHQLQISNPRFAWADLVAISKEARDHFSQRGEHAYSAVHETMLDSCKIYGINRIFGEVRIGKNENLAWQAHQKLGWKMPNEDYQRKNPINKNGNDYALIYMDVSE